MHGGSLTSLVGVPSQTVPAQVLGQTRLSEAVSQGDVEVIRTPGGVSGLSADPVTGLGAWVRQWGLAAEMLLCALVAAATLLAVGAGGLVAPTAVAVWAVANFHHGRTVSMPLDRQLRTVTRAALAPLAATAGAIGFLGATAYEARAAFAAIATVTGASVLVRIARWRLCSPMRVVAVGDRVDIAQVIKRWTGSSHVEVVGALLQEPGLAPVPDQILGVAVVEGVDEADRWVSAWSADLVAVSLGPGFGGDDFRRLAWTLEHSRVSLGVLEVLDEVSPHRITPGRLDGASVMDVRLPRPSTWVRGVKDALDRLGAAVAIVLLALPMACVAVLVRSTTRGPALFRQTRVGQEGREFTVVKFRTMIANADQLKPAMVAANEYEGALFKVKADPRVTRVGRVLRKTSMDELPQLFNVLRGEMSLVGPRPHLPGEIESMGPDARRRLAVKPGITGLWQVSGRSDLCGDKAVALDTYYADNWGLLGDAGIVARTFKAVVSGRGAY